jgi:predicted GIY-YIG superfamily endonuclease
MCGSRDGLLYVGKAKNLRQRLGQYRSANPDRLTRKLRRLLAAVEHIYWDECADETAALERERRLLLALRPKFNTAGKFPSPSHDLGWRPTKAGLEVGMGPGTAGWDRCFGGFTRLKPVYTALLRLTWRSLNPGQACYDMPAPLTAGRPPATWLFEGADGKEFDLRMIEFVNGTGPGLVDWLIDRASPQSQFERQWCQKDAEILLEFHERIRGRKAGGR